MNQSKKLLAALVAVPASVVVADSTFAADLTLNFGINNEFVGGKAVAATAVKEADLNKSIVDALTKGMNDFEKTITIDLSKVAADKAQEEVEKYFDYLKSNVNTKVNNYDTTMLYGMFKDAKVKVTESGEGDKQVVKLELTLNYYGTKDDVNATLEKLPTMTTTDALEKVKTVHDYIVSNSFITESEHSPTYLALKNTGSPYAYAMYTYMLLNKAGVDVRYVYGMKNGVYRSWNIVKIGTEWYNLDVAANDNTDRNNKDVNYRYFLTNNLGEHRITVDAEKTTAATYNHLATADNKAVSDNFIYFVDANGKIKKIDKKTLKTVDDTKLNEIKVDTVAVTSEPGKMVYVKQVSDTDPVITKESLYFVNTSMGHYLYELVIKNESTTPTYELKLLIKEPVEGILMVGTDAVKYKTASGEKTVYVSALEDDHKNAVNNVKAALNEMGALAKEIAYSTPTSTTLEHPNVKITSKKSELTTQETALVAKQKELTANNAEIVEAEKQLAELTSATTPNESAIDELKAKIVNLKKGKLNLENEKATFETAITELKEKIAQLETNTADLQNKIIKAREFYMALTPNQQKEIEEDPASKANFTELQKLEALFFPASGTNTNVNKLISNINKLDIFDDGYYSAIFAAAEVYKGLTADEKKAVYNYNILQKALEETKKVDTLNADFTKLIGTSKDPFVDVKNFISEVEKLTVRYEKLLPSLQKQITSSGFINQVKERRTTVESYRLKLSNTDETTADYLAVIKEVLTAYNKMTISEQALFTAAEVAKITAANNSTESIEGLAGSLKTALDGQTAGTTKITPELYDTLQGLIAQYNALTTAQKAELNKDTSTKTLVEKLGAFEKEITKIKNLTTLKTIEADVAKLVSTKPKTLADFEAAVKAIQTSITKFETDNKLSNSIAKFYSSTDTVQTLGTHSAALEAAPLKAAKDLIAEINKLTTSSTMTTVITLRAKSKEINAFLQSYIPILKLEEQEVRIITAEIKKLKEDATLADIKPVYDLYMSLSEEARKKVAEADSKRLIDLYNKAVASDTATKDAIKKVQEMVDKLGNQTTREQLDTLIEAYGALDKESQKQIVGYDEKVKAVEERLTAQEEADKDRLAAQNVTTMIATLNEESTEEEILEAREAYDALTDAAKDLISKGTLELLEYYESRMEELIELAEKEAKVVIDRINRITSSYTETQIKSIRVAHTALSALAKKFVTQETLQKLIDAENNIIYQNTVVKQAKLDANAFDVYMNDINRNSTTAEIAKARAYYNRLSAEARKHVTTYEKLVRLETMWKDPEYLDLVFTYYPEYIHAVKPGAIVVQKPTYDPLYIPDDSATTPTYPTSSSSVATNPVASWSAYETMRYQNGRYTTTISSTQVKNIADRNMRLKADNIEIVIPTADLKASTATVGVSVNVSNDQLNIQFTEGNNAKYFSDYVEIHVPFSVLKGNASQIIERVSSFGSAASFKVDGSTFIIRTKSSGTFRTATVSTYNDIPSGEQGTAIRELAKRGIKFDTTTRLSQSYKQVTKMDVALMIATALDLSSNAKSKYLDLESDLHVKRAQGLLEAGIMSGATSARFNPNGTITKQEAAIIIANMYRYLNQDLAKAYNTLNSNYGDIANLTLEARQSIAILELFGVVSGTGLFEPTQALTRGEFAELLYKALTAINYL